MASHGRTGGRVLIIVENLPAPFDRRVWQQAKALRDAGYQVAIICPVGGTHPARHEVLESIEIFRHPFPVEADSPLGYLLEYANALFWQTVLAWRVFCTRGFDVIQGCNPPDDIFVVAAPFKLLGKRYIYDQHDVNPEFFEAKFGRRGLLYRVLLLLERWSFRVADVVMVTNHSYRTVAEGRGGKDPDRVFVVRNGPDLQRVRPLPPNPELRCGRRFLVGYVGVMGKPEGIDLLLRVVRHIVTERGRTDVHFGLVGGGTELEHMKGYAREIGVAPYVTFTGRVPDREMLEMLSTADVCVNPSDRIGRSACPVVDAPDQTWTGAIRAHGSYASDDIPITADAVAGSMRVTVDDAAGIIVPGAVIYIYADNDPEVMYTEPEWDQSWAAAAVGQIVDVVAVQGDTVMLDTPLRVDHAPKLHPRLRVVAPVTDVGIEGLRVERLDQAEDYIISFSLADNGWIRDCEVAWATRAHIDVALSRHVTVRGNDIHHAHNYGGGGHGYGIAVTRTNDSLFEDNLIYTTRHSFMVSLGSNGNIFAYNYSRDHRSTEPYDLADVSIHGHYAHTNLLEGNVADNIRVADWWGPTPNITLYRNRVLGDIMVDDHAHLVSVVGNTVLDDAGIEIDDSVQDPFVALNRVAGEMQAGDAAGGSLPASLWRADKPLYWGDRPWPCTGADVDTGKSLCRIPAQDRDDP